MHTALLQQCQLPGPQPESSPVTLLRISAARRVWLVRQQVYDLLVRAQGHSLPTFKHLVERLGRGRGHVYHQPSRALLKQMLAMGGLNIRSARQHLITLSTAKEACKSLNLPQAVLDSLANLNEPSKLVIPIHASQLIAQNAPISLNPVDSLHMDDNLPSTLDPSPIILEDRERYSLKHHATLTHGVAFKAQLDELRAWCTADFQAGRGRTGAVQQITWEGIESECLLLLGFAHYKKGWMQPGLAAVCNASLLSSYLSSRRASGHKFSTMSKSVYSLCKVLDFWHSKPTLGPEVKLRITALNAWLRDMRGQLGQSMPRVVRDPETMKEQGEWMEAKDVVRLYDEKRRWAMERYADPGKRMRYKNAKKVHDIAMLNVMFGYMPPLRLSCIRTLLMASNEGSCTEPECVKKEPNTCRGNRMRSVGGEMQFHLPHHKNTKRWRGAAIHFTVPDGLEQLLKLYVERARPVLMQELAVEHPFVFMSTHGQRLSGSRLTQMFQSIMISWGALPIKPKDLRHIFVTERGAAGRVGGPEDDEAAQLMGNSPRSWKEVYNLNFSRRQAQNAVLKMGDWRANMLSPPEPTAEEEPAEDDFMIELT